MRIATCYDISNMEIFSHFGSCEYFKLYDVEDNKIIKDTIINNNGYSHHELVELLINLDADILLCGGIGSHAYELLNSNNIKVIPGVNGKADEAVKSLLNGENIIDLSMIHECHHKR